MRLRGASRPAPTAPPAGPESTLQAPARAASAAGTTPPEDCMTSGCGKPAAFERREMFAHAVHRRNRGSRGQQLAIDVLLVGDCQAVRRGSAIGTIQIMHVSDNEGLPTREQLAKFMAENKQKNC